MLGRYTHNNIEGDICNTTLDFKRKCRRRKKCQTKGTAREILAVEECIGYTLWLG